MSEKVATAPVHRYAITWNEDIIESERDKVLAIYSFSLISGGSEDFVEISVTHEWAFDITTQTGHWLTVVKYYRKSELVDE